jgi:hypothetical protein
MRRGLAPRQHRSAISRRRAAARARSRLPMLAQAISSTTPTAERSTSSGRRTLPTMVSVSGTTTARERP